ncbi:hypothetical protein FS837_001307 [Tulasnella sp. UAMH 9824]|nr:hypothetical protein FS837_001307 [Tulasnella sp. UAMH 9824]
MLQVPPILRLMRLLNPGQSVPFNLPPFFLVNVLTYTRSRVQFFIYEFFAQLWILAFLRPLLTGVQQLLRSVEATPVTPPSLQYEPKPGAQVAFEKPPDHGSHLDPKASAVLSKPLPRHLKSLDCGDEILPLANEPVPPLSLGVDQVETNPFRLFGGVEVHTVSDSLSGWLGVPILAAGNNGEKEPQLLRSMATATWEANPDLPLLARISRAQQFSTPLRTTPERCNMLMLYQMSLPPPFLFRSRRTQVIILRKYSLN